MQIFGTSYPEMPLLGFVNLKWCGELALCKKVLGEQVAIVSSLCPSFFTPAELPLPDLKLCVSLLYFLSCEQRLTLQAYFDSLFHPSFNNVI